MTTDPQMKNTKNLPRTSEETTVQHPLSQPRSSNTESPEVTHTDSSQHNTARTSEEEKAAAGHQDEGASFPFPSTTPLSSATIPKTSSTDQPTTPLASKVWTAADAPARNSFIQATPVRVGQLIWGFIVALLGVFFIALPFISMIDIPILFIGLTALLGLSLIIAALMVGKERTPKQKS